MDELIQPFNKKKIYKLIHYNSDKEDDYTKYVFVGPCKLEIKQLLNKLELGINLGSSDKKRLQKEFGFYDKIFGKIVPKQTFFIYYYINENVTNQHLIENICY